MSSICLTIVYSVAHRVVIWIGRNAVGLYRLDRYEIAARCIWNGHNLSVHHIPGTH